MKGALHGARFPPTVSLIASRSTGFDVDSAPEAWTMGVAMSKVTKAGHTTVIQSNPTRPMANLVSAITVV